MNLFDVIPALGRRALHGLAVTLFVGFALLPVPASGFIDGQLNDLQTQITRELMQAIPPQFRPHALHYARVAATSVSGRRR